MTFINCIISICNVTKQSNWGSLLIINVLLLQISNYRIYNKYVNPSHNREHRKEKEGCESLERCFILEANRGNGSADLQFHLFHHKFALGCPCLPLILKLDKCNCTHRLVCFAHMYRKHWCSARHKVCLKGNVIMPSQSINLEQIEVALFPFKI